MSKPKVSAAEAAKPARWSGIQDELRNYEWPLNLAQTLQQLIKLVQRAVPDHAAGVFLLDEEARTVQGQVTELFDHNLNAGEGALETALRNPASFLISSLPSRQRDQPSAKSQLVVPFRASPKVRGTLILRSPKRNDYSSQDGEALSGIVTRASVPIENALIHQKLIQDGDNDVERDMVMAQAIMARLIPQEAPRIPGLEVASINVPAKFVGGDLLDYIVLPDEHFGLLVADASGNGVPAALLMTGFRALFRGLIQNDFNIRSVFRKANQQLVESTASHQFVSAAYVSVDASTGRLIYVNGGHVPPLLYRPGWPPRKLHVGGPVLGVLPAASYHEDSVVLRPKDVLVCYSDGLSEAESPNGEVFGEDRILQVIESSQDLSAYAICNALREEATKVAGSALRDDLTICVWKYL